MNLVWFVGKTCRQSQNGIQVDRIKSEGFSQCWNGCRILLIFGLKLNIDTSIKVNTTHLCKFFVFRFWLHSLSLCNIRKNAFTKKWMAKLNSKKARPNLFQHPCNDGRKTLPIKKTSITKNMGGCQLPVKCQGETRPQDCPVVVGPQLQRVKQRLEDHLLGKKFKIG